MSTSNIVWIVIAALVLIALIAALVAVSARSKRRRQLEQAEGIREQARVDAARVERREALAQETAAKARAAQAEAEAKAAEAARLQDRAAAHQDEVATSREQLDAQLKRADTLDPNVRKDKNHRGDARDETPQDGAWSQENTNLAGRDTHPQQDTAPQHDAEHYRGVNT
ncbi:hypothetical protein [Mycobacterium asiaticum]|uniref:Uncharacterized protein n=1 Tax=Mycobacterium asiaticum TaxID=1790 RepID=A0A1A3NEU0_MYCAS|nr:hypothetical protein [Mycobacterium asiaticum]OBK19820.1 hypothetical protein A5636_17385 [Mycobacterium asiaticum]